MIMFKLLQLVTLNIYTHINGKYISASSVCTMRPSLWGGGDGELEERGVGRDGKGKTDGWGGEGREGRRVVWEMGMFVLNAGRKRG